MLYFRQIMRKHTTLLLIIWGVLTSTTTIYFWSYNQKQEKINDLLTESISLHKKALSNEVKSYYVINDCFVVKRGLCNADEFKKTLNTLGNEADELYNRIWKIENEMK